MLPNPNQTVSMRLVTGTHVVLGTGMYVWKSLSISLFSHSGVRMCCSAHRDEAGLVKGAAAANNIKKRPQNIVVISGSVVMNITH